MGVYPQAERAGFVEASTAFEINSARIQRFEKCVYTSCSLYYSLAGSRHSLPCP